MPIPQIGPLPPVPPQGFAPDLLGQLLQSAVSGYTQGQLQKPEYERLITEQKLREIQLQTEQQKQLQETLQTMLPLLQGNPALLQDPTVQAKLSDLFKGLNIPIPPGGITPRTVATLAYGPKERATILDKLPDLLAMPPDARRAYAQTLQEEAGIDLPDPCRSLGRLRLSKPSRSVMGLRFPKRRRPPSPRSPSSCRRESTSSRAARTWRPPARRKLWRARRTFSRTGTTSAH